MKYEILAAAVFLFSMAGMSASATENPTTSTTASTTSIASLIEQLKRQIAVLSAAKEAKQQVKETSLQIKSQLKEGMSSEDVKLLQEFLASDPELYPEGKITGYFGRLTKIAVQKFQKKVCISNIGSVGPQTLSRINEILTEGAGNSGHVPAGLLKASGIQKKLCSTNVSNSTSTATSASDTAAPIISAVSAKEIGTSTAKITWKTNEWSDGKVYYSPLTPIDTSSTSTLNTSVNGLFKSHNLVLSGMDSTTTYYYFVASKDNSGNTAASTESSFVTLP